MKFKILFFLVLLLALGCGKPNEPTSEPFDSFSYPLEVGNVWTYERTLTYSNVQPDTTSLWFPLDMKGSAQIKVNGTDKLGTDIEVVELKASTVFSMNPEYADSATFWFKNEADGLYEYGNIGTNLAVPVSRPSFEYDLKQNSQKKFDIKNSFSASPTPAPIVKHSLKYPIELNSEWLFVDESDYYFTLYKKVIRFEQLLTKAGRYNCFVVEWIVPFEDNTIIDYYSEIGLMKRTITAKNIQACDESLLNCATFDMREEYTLVDFSQAE